MTNAEEETKKKEILDFWNNLIKYNIQRYTHVNIIYNGDSPILVQPVGDVRLGLPHSYREYEAFSMNINRIMRLYQELFREPLVDDRISIKALSTHYKSDIIPLKDLIISETIIIFLVSAIEVYLEDTFRKVAKNLKLKDLDNKYLPKFIRDFHIEGKLRKIKKKISTQDLSAVLEVEMDFQNKDIIKNAYKLIKIEIPKLVGSLWQEILDKKRSDSLIARRHTIIHALSRTIEKFRISKEEIRDFIDKTCKFIFKIENKKKLLYSTILPEVYF